MTGISAFLDVLYASGVEEIFGNPGTTELPLNDALAADSRFKYFLGLHEVPVVAMADGYAMARGFVGVANVHVACGLGNSMGMLYNAYVEGTPLLLTAGSQDRRLIPGGPVLHADLVSVAKPWTKWSAQIDRVEDVPAMTRRALEVALGRPTGPVFLALPLDLQSEATTELDVSRPELIDRSERPSAESIDRAARLLLEARSPAILAGSRVTESLNSGRLDALAEWIGAPVYGEAATSHGRTPIDPDSTLYAGPLPLWSPEVRKALEPYDLLFVVGMNFLRLYIWCEPEQPVPPGVRIIHADSHDEEIGKNHAVDVGLAGDLTSVLTDLIARIRELTNARGHEAHVARGRAILRRRHEEIDAIRVRAKSERATRPMTALTLMDAISRAWPKNGALVDEAVTTSRFLLERLGTLSDADAYFGHRGWALGWGIGCAIGVKVAWRERPVLGLIGDGAAMYGIQGLWTAAHHRIPVTFVIANNAQYKILKDCSEKLPLPQMKQGRFVGMDLTDPEIDFVGLARSLGVEAVRVSEPDELTERLRESWNRTTPILFDVPIER